MEKMLGGLFSRTASIITVALSLFSFIVYMEYRERRHLGDADNSRTKGLIQNIEISLNSYYKRHSSYPECSGANTSIIFGKYLIENQYDGPPLEVRERFKSGNLIVDAFGREIIYIPSGNYEGSPFAIKISGGKYCNPDTFQIRSFGKNGIDDKGRLDDVQNFVVPYAP